MSLCIFDIDRKHWGTPFENLTNKKNGVRTLISMMNDAATSQYQLDSPIIAKIIQSAEYRGYTFSIDTGYVYNWDHEIPSPQKINAPSDDSDSSCTEDLDLSDYIAACKNLPNNPNRDDQLRL